MYGVPKTKSMAENETWIESKEMRASAAWRNAGRSLEVGEERILEKKTLDISSMG